MLLIKIILFILSLKNSFSEVLAPNYQFQFDKVFAPYLPNKKITQLLKDKKLEIVETRKNFILYKSSIREKNFQFTIFIQTKDQVIYDFYTRLPAYFLHHIFHQTLINRYGLQDKYFKKEEQAVYLWNNKSDVNHVYSGACTITCFPLFYTQYRTFPNSKVEYTPFFKKINTQ